MVDVEFLEFLLPDPENETPAMAEADDAALVVFFCSIAVRVEAQHEPIPRSAFRCVEGCENPMVALSSPPPGSPNENRSNRQQPATMVDRSIDRFCPMAFGVIRSMNSRARMIRYMGLLVLFADGYRWKDGIASNQNGQGRPRTKRDNRGASAVPPGSVSGAERSASRCGVCGAPVRKKQRGDRKQTTTLLAIPGPAPPSNHAADEKRDPNNGGWTVYEPRRTQGKPTTSERKPKPSAATTTQTGGEAWDRFLRRDLPSYCS